MNLSNLLILQYWFWITFITKTNTVWLCLLSVSYSVVIGENSHTNKTVDNTINSPYNTNN